MKGRLPSGGVLAGFVAGTIFAIVPGVLVVGFAAVIAGHSERPLAATLLMGLSIALVLSLSVAFGLLVRKLVNRFVHRQQ